MQQNSSICLETTNLITIAPNDSTGQVDAVIAVENCIRDIRLDVWDEINAKDDKTEFLLIGAQKQLAKMSIDGIRVCDYSISPSPCHQSVIWAHGSTLHYQDMQQCILLSLQYETY